MNNRTIVEIVIDEQGTRPADIDFNNVESIEIRHYPERRNDDKFKKFYPKIVLCMKSGERIRIVSSPASIKKDIKSISGSMKTTYSFTHEEHKNFRVVKATDRDIAISFPEE